MLNAAVPKLAWMESVLRLALLILIAMVRKPVPLTLVFARLQLAVALTPIVLPGKRAMLAVAFARLVRLVAALTAIVLPGKPAIPALAVARRLRLVAALTLNVVAGKPAWMVPALLLALLILIAMVRRHVLLILVFAQLQRVAALTVIVLPGKPATLIAALARRLHPVVHPIHNVAALKPAWAEFAHHLAPPTRIVPLARLALLEPAHLVLFPAAAWILTVRQVKPVSPTLAPPELVAKLAPTAIQERTVYPVAAQQRPVPPPLIAGLVRPATLGFAQLELVAPQTLTVLLDKFAILELAQLKVAV
ncbi:hypothetical protein EDB80DRAFT_704339 [Ilyonectria destructans]|nr:hypothetical protein EDB80DRAFT_704339 [Ilyonectria destructans]